MPEINDGAQIEWSEGTGSVLTASIVSGSVDTADLADGAVTTAKIDAGAVDTTELADGAVTDAKMSTGIDAAKLGNGTVSSTEFQYLNGVTSAIQAQLNSKLSLSGGTMTDDIVMDAGKGIDFSANAGTVAAGATTTNQVLTDYEEGTWTPELYGSTGSAGAFAVDGVNGYYTKIGRQVTINGYINNITNKGSYTGNALIKGLPFTPANNTGSIRPASIALDRWVTNNQLNMFVLANSTNIIIQNGSSAYSWTSVPRDDGTSGAENFLGFSLTYEVA